MSSAINSGTARRRVSAREPSVAARAVSAANSLVGSKLSDNIGRSVTALTNGNYVVSSTFWDNGAAATAGAVTLCSGTSGCPTGAVSALNSLVGTTANENVGAVVTAL